MKNSTVGPNLNVLHILTLNGRNGEYGGPVRVAREICSELNKRGNTASIFSGALKGAEPIPMLGTIQTYVLVKPIVKKLGISSLWSWSLCRSLDTLIRNSDVIHIHFARDLISILSATIAILRKKPYVAQTHGMLIHDGRMSTRFLDLIFTRPLLNKAGQIFALSKKELSDLKKLKLSRGAAILPNGVSAQPISNFRSQKQARIVFCSRLEKRKGVEKFIGIANTLRHSGYKFEVYGPDSGELNFLLAQIDELKLHGILEYKGSLQPEQVQQVLKDIDLVVLPSKNEPFPMIILEAMAVGTAVLVMPSCGISGELGNFRRNFVSETEDLDGLVKSLEISMSRRSMKERQETREFCEESFSIKRVADTLENVYRNLNLRNGVNLAEGVESID